MRSWERTGLGVLLGLALCAGAGAQQTNTPAHADYPFFKVIPDRNIFNPNRSPHRPGSPPTATGRAPAADTFALVGTMSYAKGTFAFFDGSSTAYQKVLERDGSIAGFKLTAIETNSVRLVAGDKPIELKVGGRLRRDDEAGWQLVPEAETSSVSPGGGAATAGATSDGGGEQNEILKKLMQQREQELK